MYDKLARRITRKFHGNERNAEGYLLTPKHYLYPEQETAVGYCYLGLSGFPLFFLTIVYVVIKYGEGGEAHFPSMAEMPSEVKAVFVVAVAALLMAIVAIHKAASLWNEISYQPRSNSEN